MRAKRTDANQASIMAVLRQVGATVVDLSAVGKGCPDLLVGHRGVTYLLEVKNVKGKNKTTPDQDVFYAWWRGAPVAIVRTADEALQAIGATEGQ
jgi:hypothetical protein